MILKKIVIVTHSKKKFIVDTYKPKYTESLRQQYYYLLLPLTSCIYLPSVSCVTDWMQLRKAKD